MSETTETPEVVRNDDAGRYEILLGGERAGLMVFEADADGKLVLPHTEIDKKFGGRGLATTLVSDALADIAQRGEAVVPQCPFVVKYLKEHDVAGLQVAWPEGEAADAATGGEQPA